jgi:HPt (histidine-containing phosphotransfer) domain-containing protein
VTVDVDALDQRIVNALRDFGSEPGALLGVMLQEFLIEAPSLVVEVERAVEDRACAPAARAAHRLCGISGHVGALRLARIASVVEVAADTGSRCDVAKLRAELDLAVAEASGLLRCR